MARASSVAQPSDPEDAALTNHSVLVIDDDPLTLETVSAILETERYEVRRASGGDEALRALDQASVSLVLLDLSLPNGESTAVARALRDRHSPTRIVVLSGAPEAEERAAEMRADGLIAKPFELDAFLEEVARLCQDS
jgi:DNA-binding response OmpR family regulator